ncbi:hypothetical protein QBC46DRAFT_387423, partial [Diplogelasinospora grovesii]
MSSLHTLLPPVDFGPPPHSIETSYSLHSRTETDSCISAADLLQLEETFLTSISPSSDDLCRAIAPPHGSQDAIEWNLDPTFLASTVPEHRHVLRRTSRTTSPAVSERRVSHRTRPADDRQSSSSRGEDEKTTAASRSKPFSDLRCWDHGCNGRAFTTSSNLKRHQRERSSSRASHLCPLCGAHFSRTTARNEHIQNRSCTRIRRYSNGRQRASKIGRRSAIDVPC